MNHSLYQDGILKPSPFKRLPWLLAVVATSKLGAIPTRESRTADHWPGTTRPTPDPPFARAGAVRRAYAPAPPAGSDRSYSAIPPTLDRERQQTGGRAARSRTERNRPCA